MRDPLTRARWRAIYTPLLTTKDMRDTARVVVELLDLIDELTADLAQSRAEKRALAAMHTWLMTHDEALARLRALYERVGSMPSIALSAGVSHMTVSRALDGVPGSMANVLGGLGYRVVTMYEEQT